MVSVTPTPGGGLEATCCCGLGACAHGSACPTLPHTWVIALRPTPHPLHPLSFVSPTLHHPLMWSRGQVECSMHWTYVALCQCGGPSLTGGRWRWWCNQRCNTRCASHALYTLEISWHSKPRTPRPMSFVLPVLHPLPRRGLVVCSIYSVDAALCQCGGPSMTCGRSVPMALQTQLRVHFKVPHAS